MHVVSFVLIVNLTSFKNVLGNSGYFRIYFKNYYVVRNIVPSIVRYHNQPSDTLMNL